MAQWIKDRYFPLRVEKAGLSPARDFALGVLTERVRQEEEPGDGFPPSRD